MKFLIVLFAIAGLSAALPTRDLHGDLQQIVALFPREEIRAIAHKYAQTDAEVQNIIVYLKGPEWAKLVADVKAQQAVQDLNKFLEANGIDVDAILEYIHNIIANARSVQTKRHVRSLRNMLDEIKAVIPKDKILSKIDDLLTNSSDFQNLYEQLSGDDFRNMVLAVKALPEVQRLRNRLIELNVDIDAIEKFFKDLFGWN